MRWGGEVGAWPADELDSVVSGIGAIMRVVQFKHCR